MKQYDEALEYFDKSLELAPNFHAMYNTATLYFEKHEFDLALDWFEKSKEFTKHDHEIKLADLGIATVMERKRSYDEAILIYQKYGLKDKAESSKAAKLRYQQKLKDEENKRLGDEKAEEEVKIKEYSKEEEDTKVEKEIVKLQAAPNLNSPILEKDREETPEKEEEKQNIEEDEREIEAKNQQELKQKEEAQKKEQEMAKEEEDKLLREKEEKLLREKEQKLQKEIEEKERKLKEEEQK